jgi:hypothetical protein
MIHKTVLTVCLLILPALAFARPAQGPGRNNDAAGNSGTARSEQARQDRPLVARLPHVAKDPQCLKECRDGFKGCVGDARDTAAPCFEGCQPLIAAARAACVEDLTSAECQEARDAVHDCVQPCREELQPALRVCAEAGSGCVEECPMINDLQCLENCGSAQRACLGNAGEQSRVCFGECGPEFDAVREACKQDRESEVCAAAREALHLCMELCKETVRQSVEGCRDAFRTCSTACGSQAPTE